MWLDTLHKTAEQVSTAKVVTAGAAGSVVSIGTALSDPAQLELWLRIATLGVGFLTGLGSFVLVFIKIIDSLFGGKRDKKD